MCDRRFVASTLFPAAVLGCVPWALALASRRHDLPAALQSAGTRAILTTDALVFEAMLLTVAGPLAGVAIAAMRAPLTTTWAALLTTLAGFFGVSLLFQLWLSAPDASGVYPLVQGRIAVAATALALGALGALFAARLSDVLDAAAMSLLIALIASGGLIAAGPVTSALPQSAIDAGLLASPVIAATAAAGIDLLRSAELYRFSPIAHRRFGYPSWSSVALWYLSVAGCCLASAAGDPRRNRSPQAA